MRLHSDSFSIERREITVFAIIECLVSTALYGLFAWYTGALVHFEIAIALGPLFLLRTRFSYDLGLRLWKGLWNKSGDIMEANVLALLFVPFLLAAGMIIRPVATAAGVLRHPYHALRNIPDNWIRQALCTDVFTPPEIIPGENGAADEVPTFSALIGMIRDGGAVRGERGIEKIAYSTGRLTVLILGYIPALLVRISFKATSFIYLPLIWVAGFTASAQIGLKLRLERLTKGELEKYRRRLSGFILLLFAARLGFSNGLIERQYVVDQIGSPILTARLLEAWPWWQIGLVFDAALTFALFLGADAALARSNEGVLRNERIVEFAVVGATFLRALLATIIVLCAVGGAFMSVGARFLPKFAAVMGR